MKPRYIKEEAKWGKPEEARLTALANDILLLLQSPAMKDIPVKLSASETAEDFYYDLTLPQFKDVPTKADLEAKILDKGIPEEKRNSYRHRLAGQWHQDGHPSMNFAFCKIRINDNLQILGISGEPTSVLGRALKESFKPKATIVLGYIRDQSYYICTWAQELEGGYEAKGYQESSEKIIIDIFKKLQ